MNNEKPLLRAPPVPCASCPYRKDVPSGIWAKSEYDKLPNYDGPTWTQSRAVFLCHQRDGSVCGGWLACHDPQELLALRFQGANVDPSVFEYKTTVPIFDSGQEARAHGLRDMAKPNQKAVKLIEGITKKIKRNR